MKPHRNSDGERILAVFIDFENLALGFGGRRDKFSIEKVLERLVEKGKIVAKKAYADWSRFGNYASSLHAAAVELVEIPKRVQTGKNSADIRMCVDAMDLAYSKDHIDSFVIVSGDSDFSPLVSKLKELGKHVIGLGLVDSTSDLLRDNCDEFIYYEDLDRVDVSPLVENPGIPEIKRKAFALLVDSLLALRRENKELIYSSMAKDTMKRKKPSFNEEYHGYRTFSDLLEDAQKFGIVDLERHKTSGAYIITRFGEEPAANPGVVIGVVTRPALKVAEAGPRALPEPPSRREPVSIPEPRSRERGERVERRDERVERPGDRNRRRVEVPLAVKPPVAPPLPPPIVPQPAPMLDPLPVRPAEDDLEERLPLGRALMEELDDELDDEVPSYRPRKAVTKPSEPKSVEPKAVEPKPASRTRTEPAGRAKSVGKATEPKRPDPKLTTASRRDASREESSPGESGRKPSGRGRATKSVERTPAAAKPTPRPPTPPDTSPVADDDFGAGVL